MSDLIRLLKNTAKSKADEYEEETGQKANLHGYLEWRAADELAAKDAEIAELKADNERLREVVKHVDRWLAAFIAAWDKSLYKKKPSEAPVALMEAIRQHSLVRAALEQDDDTRST